MDHAAIAQLLEAWALWSRQDRTGPPARIRAGSAEGQHRPEAGALFADDLHALQPRIGDDLGLRVERAVVAIGNPGRDALTLHYIAGLPVAVIGGRLGVRDPGQVLDQAHAAVARRLR
jgi:hypothetical protein